MSASVTRVASSGVVHKFQANIPGATAPDSASPFTQILDAMAAGAVDDQDPNGDGTDNSSQDAGQDNGAQSAKPAAGKSQPSASSASQSSPSLPLDLAGLLAAANPQDPANGDQDSANDNSATSAATDADATGASSASAPSKPQNSDPATANPGSQIPAELQALIQTADTSKTTSQPQSRDTDSDGSSATPTTDASAGTSSKPETKPDAPASTPSSAQAETILAKATKDIGDTPAPLPATDPATSDKSSALETAKAAKGKDKADSGNADSKDKTDRKADQDPAAAAPETAPLVVAANVAAPFSVPTAKVQQSAADNGAIANIPAAGDTPTKTANAGTPAQPTPASANSAPAEALPAGQPGQAGGIATGASPLSSDPFLNSQDKSATQSTGDGKPSQPVADKTAPAAASPIPAPAQSQSPITPDSASLLAQNPLGPHAATDATPIGQHVQVSASDSHAANIASLAIAIAAKSQSGNKEFEIRLDPPELGRVEVRLSIDQNGKAQANLAADQPRTLDLLRNDAPQLQRALRDAGLNVAQNGLNFSLRGQDRQNANGNSGGAGRSKSPSVSLTAVSAIGTVKGGANYQGPANGRLDIRV